jgi:hypothetical protein
MRRTITQFINKSVDVTCSHCGALNTVKLESDDDSDEDDDEDPDLEDPDNDPDDDSEYEDSKMKKNTTPKTPAENLASALLASATKNSTKEKNDSRKGIMSATVKPAAKLSPTTASPEAIKALETALAKARKELRG